MIAGAALFGPLVGAVATLGGVLVAQRASKKRERESRLWDMRVDAYRDITKWLLNTKVSLHGQGYVSGEALSAENVTSFQSLLKSLLPSDDLTARVTISVSDRIEVVFTSSTQTMTRLTYDTLNTALRTLGRFYFRSHGCGNPFGLRWHLQIPAVPSEAVSGQLIGRGCLRLGIPAERRCGISPRQTWTIKKAIPGGNPVPEKFTYVPLMVCGRCSPAGYVDVGPGAIVGEQ